MMTSAGDDIATIIKDQLQPPLKDKALSLKEMFDKRRN